MTRSLSEPSTPGMLANYGYRIRQLERRPGPRGVGLPGCKFQASRNIFTSAENSAVSVDGEGFAKGENFWTNSDIFEWTTADRTHASGKRPWFTLKSPGRYLMTLEAYLTLHADSINRAPVNEGEVNTGLCIKPNPEVSLSPMFLDRYGMHAYVVTVLFGRQQVFLTRAWTVDLDEAGFFEDGLTKVAPLLYLNPFTVSTDATDSTSGYLYVTRLGEVATYVP